MNTDDNNERENNHMTNYHLHEVANGVPVKMWTRGVPVEDEARKQLENAARLPIVSSTSPPCPTCTTASALPWAR